MQSHTVLSFVGVILVTQAPFPRRVSSAQVAFTPFVAFRCDAVDVCATSRPSKSVDVQTKNQCVVECRQPECVGVNYRQQENKCDVFYNDSGPTDDDYSRNVTGCQYNQKRWNQSLSCGYIFDVNECLINRGGCNPTANCTNTRGSYYCACKPGYTVTGFTNCTDVNECLMNNGGCNSVANCSNTIGSFYCTCNAGYTGNGFSCSDVNECLINNGGCNSVANCSNTIGSFYCTCNAGYTGNGFSCSDINECVLNNGGCISNAYCVNTMGSSRCECRPGYIGDGINCTALPNVALLRPTWQSSTNCSIPTYCSAGYAVDGQSNLASGMYCSLTAIGDSNPWLGVDLGQQYYVQSLVIFGRAAGYGCSLQNFTVSLSNSAPNLYPPTTNPYNYTLCCQYPGILATGKWFTCRTGLPVFRYVTVMMYQQYLAICDIFVYGYL